MTLKDRMRSLYVWVGRRILPGAALVAGGISVDEVALVARLMSSQRGESNLMIDVGAHDGYASEAFLRLGWSVLAFEPDTENRVRLIKRLGTHRRLRIDERALSDTKGRADWFRSGDSTGISSMAAFHESHYVADKVEVTTLHDALSESDGARTRVLKTDVEGFDLRVLRGADWASMAPDVVISEYEDRKAEVAGDDFTHLCDYLLELGFRLLIAEWFPVSEYGVRHRFRRVGRYPSRRWNPESWGNVIATRSGWLRMRLFVRLWIAALIGRARSVMTL